jgi:hypothetical protein
MAWFRNHYECAACGESWTDEWSCCPVCGDRHIAPVDVEGLTRIIVGRATVSPRIRRRLGN